LFGRTLRLSFLALRDTESEQCSTIVFVFKVKNRLSVFARADTASELSCSYTAMRQLQLKRFVQVLNYFVSVSTLAERPDFDKRSQNGPKKFNGRNQFNSCRDVRLVWTTVVTCTEDPSSLTPKGLARSRGNISSLLYKPLSLTLSYRGCTDYYYELDRLHYGTLIRTLW
jgi:hypothetical protein